MSDNIDRKRLKQKMLERWENEGGRIAPDTAIAEQTSLAGQREVEETSPEESPVRGDEP